MDRALDDVVRERHQNRRKRNQHRRSTPRGGVRKPDRVSGGSYDESRLWVHDKFESDSNAGSSKPVKLNGFMNGKTLQTGAKIKVENIHYELGHEELLELFRRQGPVKKLDIVYDRAGRSEGVAFVTYEAEADAMAAIKEYDGANANGQPITLTLVSRVTASPAGMVGRVGQPRSLFERIDLGDAPTRERRRSTGDRRDPTRKPTPPGIDRYVPSERRRERDFERTQTGPKSLEARDSTRGTREIGGRNRRGGGRDSGNGVGRTGNGGSNRPRKTVEELDAEMNDYFGNADNQDDGGDGVNNTLTAAAVSISTATNNNGEDEDMIL